MVESLQYLCLKKLNNIKNSILNDSNMNHIFNKLLTNRPDIYIPYVNFSNRNDWFEEDFTFTNHTLKYDYVSTITNTIEYSRLSTIDLNIQYYSTKDTRYFVKNIRINHNINNIREIKLEIGGNVVNTYYSKMHRYMCISDNVEQIKYIPQTIYCKGINKKYIYRYSNKQVYYSNI